MTRRCTGLGSVYQPTRAETPSVEMSTETKGCRGYSPEPARSDYQSCSLCLNSASSLEKTVRNNRESFHPPSSVSHIVDILSLFFFFLRLFCASRSAARDRIMTLWQLFFFFLNQPVQQRLVGGSSLASSQKKLCFLSKTRKHQFGMRENHSFCKYGGEKLTKLSFEIALT